MVRPEVAGQKIARASARLVDAEARLARPVEEFVANVADRDLASFYLFLAIQECIDLAAHWVADAGLAPPDDARSTFDVLADSGAIARDLAEAMKDAAGLRNRIGHGYAELDHGRLHREAREGVEALRRFLAAVAGAAGL
jgi:uncharacterized protein YutE (UPF0331/DUF86 family)